MKIAHFFIDRPRFATVLSFMIVVFGVLSYFSLPVSQYPEIAPPQIQVIASYPGANAETVAQTVATPLEQEINGVENMIYMSSQATNDGEMRLSITFEQGTDVNTAQVLVQNRVSAALPRLPESVRSRGVTTIKSAPDFLLAINLYSPGGTYDQNYIGNYASLEINDQLKRLDGVGNSQTYGASNYSMRIWLDPDRLAFLGLTAQDVVESVRSQNIQVAGGILNQSPVPNQHAFELTVQTQGRLVDEQEFENIIIKSGDRGALVRLKDVARIELGAENYVTRGYLNDTPSVIIALTMRPGANALDTSDTVIKAMQRLSENFPADLEYKIIYNPTTYIEESMNEVFQTLFVSMILVIVVIIVFLQSWRTAIIPVIAIPISLIGTFAVMLMAGFSLNMLSLFGLILAIGIVVDDAIVVVENVERKLREGMEVRQATKETMDEVGIALVATSLVLVAVFLPTVLMEGISGQFYKQFGVTIAAATMISTVVSITLSPVMATILMKAPVDRQAPMGFLEKASNGFNNFIDNMSGKYAFIVRKLVRMTLVVSVVYVGLITLTGYQFSKIPTGFIPAQDNGVAIAIINLPSGASLDRTDAVVQRVSEAILSVDGVEDTVSFTGFSAATNANASNAGAIFAVLEPLGERPSLEVILTNMQRAFSTIDDAFVLAISPPPVPGIGNASGYKMMIQDRGAHGPVALEQAAWALAAAANQAEETRSAYTFFETGTPRIYLDIDRDRARRLNVPLSSVFSTLEINLGSAYINDFNFLGRTFRVTAQADAEYRLTKDDVLRLRVRSEDGNMVPIGSIATVHDTSGPSRVPRYNLYPSAAVSGETSPGFSSGQAIARMEQLAESVLPDGFDYEWTELAYEEKNTGNTAIIIFILAVLFVFLLLSAQYESYTLPLAILLIVPMCLLSAGAGLLIAGMDNNILTQIGLVVLIGLASKNAILIVEFAKQNEQEKGMDVWNAAVEACRLRLRPILMTALSFILGVLPLLFASGAGFEMRQAIGLTVFSGMLGVTLFGLFLTPVFYVICRKMVGLVSTDKVNLNKLNQH
ncbi:efflux RND transporter permease subunit [Sessilibacter corallicola]|uniref:efflux RND transporter permease subunit n=1 Tax=Sessilibacter corallicola TaxID=2904075 RepID=UPI001E297E85|nr:multidrug efflux RND transporter permease subunit [Sessilibacter corallicola]MCE2029620.1 efflux RND transporter permease subunit [Sessilibacter corallicola]